MVSKIYKNIFSGIIVIIIGIILGGNYFHFWDFSLFFPGWWTFFIIIPSVISILNRSFRNGFTWLFVGLFLLFLSLDVITIALFVPLLLILLGFSMVFPIKYKGLYPAKVEYFAICSNLNTRVRGKFLNCKMLAILGEIDIDLKMAVFEDNQEINITTFLGAVNLNFKNDVCIIVNGEKFDGNKSGILENSKVININFKNYGGNLNIK